MRRELKRKMRKLRFRLAGGTRYSQSFYCDSLVQSLRGSKNQSDISDHLSTLFYHVMEAQPRLIVELGTRGGESTRVLLAVARLARSRVLSVDIEDCRSLDLEQGVPWEFIQSDDVAFAVEFPRWCAQRDLPPKADALFIDTSHRYEHTKSELAAWVPHLADDGVLILHDTNMGAGTYSRLDGTVDLGWDNQRGVIRAIEEFLGTHYDENRFFTDVRNGFLILHYPYCNGLTILKRMTVAN